MSVLQENRLLFTPTLMHKQVRISIAVLHKLMVLLLTENLYENVHLKYSLCFCLLLQLQRF